MRRDGALLAYFHHRAERLRHQLLAPPYCQSLRGALSYSYNSSSSRHLFQMRHLRRDVRHLVFQVRQIRDVMHRLVVGDTDR